MAAARSVLAAAAVVLVPALALEVMTSNQTALVVIAAIVAVTGAAAGGYLANRWWWIVLYVLMLMVATPAALGALFDWPPAEADPRSSTGWSMTALALVGVAVIARMVRLATALNRRPIRRVSQR